MIENQFVLWKLDLKQEKSTRDIYNKVKDCWIELVGWDNSKSQFVIKQEKFEEILESFEEKAPKSTGESIDLTQVTTDSLLPKDSEINMDLLKRALIDLAFKNYTLDTEGIGAYVRVKQREEKSNWFERFLRTDLKDVSFSENRNVVYGIMYKIERGRLEFSGMPDQDLEGETLVVQITNYHGRILKEFWIHGVGHKNDLSSEMMKSYGVL